ncbi:hypothetical protein [Leucobacter luti]|uniref:hypothetical protein n=1 Tax=Leucobacter luti TaxID=340320 RepID=UPI003D0054AB
MSPIQVLRTAHGVEPAPGQLAAGDGWWAMIELLSGGDGEVAYAPALAGFVPHRPSGTSVWSAPNGRHCGE